MRKLGLTLVLAALTALVVIGCSEDVPDPRITRLHASETCGVVPLRVDFRADASGGKPLSEPTGGNTWLKLSWDFGDGTTIEDGTSIAFHRYDEPGIYTVTVTAEDDDGEQASRSLMVRVDADSLQIETYGLIDDLPVAEVMACQPLTLGIIAETCGFDPVGDSYDRFVYRWTASGQQYTGMNPQHTFLPAELGEQEIFINILDPSQSITRNDTLRVNVVENPGADLSLAADWLQSDPASPDRDLTLTSPVWPDTLTYTIRVQNAGPATAYNLTVSGTIPDFSRIYFFGAESDNGSTSYANANRRWTWRIPEIPADGEATVDITFWIEVTQTTTYSFTTTMEAYACDPDPGDLQIVPRLLIQTFR